MLPIEQLHLDSLRSLRRDRCGQWRQFRAVGCGDQIAALNKARGGVFVPKVVAKVLKNVPRVLRQLYVLAHGIVRAQNARRLGCGARPNLAALQHQHTARSQSLQVVGHRASDNAGTDYYHVVLLHSPSPKFECTNLMDDAARTHQHCKL